MSKYINNVVNASKTKFCYSSELDQGKRIFCSPISKKKVINKLDLTKDNHLYEIIKYDSPCRAYLDIDIDRTDKKIDQIYKLTTEKKADDFVNLLCDRLNQEIYKKDKLVKTVLTCHRENKFSYHVIFPNIKFSSNEFQLEAYNHFKKDIYPMYNKIFDTSVYYKNKNFRMLGQSKKAKTGVFEFSELSDTKNIEDTYITVLNENESKIENELKYKQIIKKKKKIIKESQEYYEIIKDDRDKELIGIKPIIIDIVKNKELTHSEFYKLGLYLKGYGNFEIFKEICEIKYGNSDQAVKYWNDFKISYCNIKSLYYFIENDEIKEKFKKTIIDNYKQYISLTIKPDITVDKKYLNQYEDIFQDIVNNKVSVFRSQTGTGKSTAVVEILCDQYKDNKILTITSRKSMASELKNKLDDQFKENKDDKRLTSYLDISSSDYNDQNIFAIQIDSLIKLNVSLWKNSYLYLDEFNSSLKYLMSSTLQNKRLDVITKFIELIKNSKKVIITDADISDMSLNFLYEIIDKKDIIFVDNIYQNGKNMVANIYEKTLNWEDKMFEVFRTGEKFFMCSDHKTEIQETVAKLQKIHQEEKLDFSFIKDKDYYVFTSIDGDNKILKDFNNECVDKWVFYSPKILYGNDYNNKLFKTKVFGHYANKKKLTINAEQIIQQLMRVRNIDQFYILLGDKNKKKFREFVNVKDVEYKYKYWLDENNNDIIKKNELEKTFNIIFYNYINDDDHLKSDQFRHVTELLKRKGCKLIFKDQYEKEIVLNKKRKVFNDISKVISTENERETYNKLFKEYLNDEEYNKDLFEKIFGLFTTTKIIKDECLLKDTNLLKIRKIFTFMLEKYDIDNDKDNYNLQEFIFELLTRYKPLELFIMYNYLGMNEEERKSFKTYKLKNEFKELKLTSIYNTIDYMYLFCNILGFDDIVDGIPTISYDKLIKKYHCNIDYEFGKKEIQIINKLFKWYKDTNKIDKCVTYGDLYINVINYQKTMLQCSFTKQKKQKNNKRIYYYEFSNISDIKSNFDKINEKCK